MQEVPQLVQLAGSCLNSDSILGQIYFIQSEHRRGDDVSQLLPRCVPIVDASELEVNFFHVLFPYT